jgi:translation initiation factor IF-1
MPKNTTGGNKAKKGKNSGQRVERPLIFADDSGAQRYGIIEAFGGSTATVKFLSPAKFSSSQMETITAVGFIRNSLRKWCKRFLRGDVVLICEREFEAGKVDIFHKYNEDEIRGLKRVQQEYSKIQPLIELYSLKMQKSGNKSGTGATKVDGIDAGDGIEFDEEYNASEEEEEEYEYNSEGLDARMMNEEYSEDRRGGYNSLSARQRNDNPKYAKQVSVAGRQQSKKQSNARPIAPQQGTRELPPSDGESDSEVADSA